MLAFGGEEEPQYQMGTPSRSFVNPGDVVLTETSGLGSTGVIERDVQFVNTDLVPVSSGSIGNNASPIPSFSITQASEPSLFAGELTASSTAASGLAPYGVFEFVEAFLAGPFRSLNPTLKGWYEYFKHSMPHVFKGIDGYVRGRLRSILRRQTKRKGRARGTDHHRWPNTYFSAVGLFSLEQARAAACRSS